MTRFAFTIAATDGRARTGTIAMRRGEIRTPAFMPVGTAATVKALTVDQVGATGADIILGNTYHLMLRPGAERVARLGGLHRFMNWDRPILTDSGGFQVMSLSALRKISEQGVTFRSHVDGAVHEMSPERSIEIQADRIGADISMQLDQCVAYPAEPVESHLDALVERDGQTLFELTARLIDSGVAPAGTSNAMVTSTGSPGSARSPTPTS